MSSTPPDAPKLERVLLGAPFLVAWMGLTFSAVPGIAGGEDLFRVPLAAAVLLPMFGFLFWARLYSQNESVRSFGVAMHLLLCLGGLVGGVLGTGHALLNAETIEMQHWVYFGICAVFGLVCLASLWAHWSLEAWEERKPAGGASRGRHASPAPFPETPGPAPQPWSDGGPVMPPVADIIEMPFGTFQPADESGPGGASDHEVSVEVEEIDKYPCGAYHEHGFRKSVSIDGRTICEHHVKIYCDDTERDYLDEDKQVECLFLASPAHVVCFTMQYRQLNVQVFDASMNRLASGSTGTLRDGDDWASAPVDGEHATLGGVLAPARGRDFDLLWRFVMEDGDAARLLALLR